MGTCPNCATAYDAGYGRGVDTLTSDLQRITNELGIPARPYSGHEAMERDILPAIRRLRQIEAVYESVLTRKLPPSSLLTFDVCPGCGHTERGCTCDEVIE